MQPTQATGQSNTNQPALVQPDINNLKGYEKAKIVGLAILSTLGVIFGSVLVLATTPLILLSLMITGPFGLAVIAKNKEKGPLFASAVIIIGLRFGSLFTIPLVGACVANLHAITHLKQ